MNYINEFENMNQYFGYLKNIAILKGLSPEDAEDSTQDCFILAWRFKDQFQGRSMFRTWLVSILINSINMKFRTRRKLRRITEVSYDMIQENDTFSVMKDNSPSPEDNVILNDLMEICIDETTKLSPCYKNTLLLFMLGKSNQETADELGINIGSAKAYRSKGIVSLKNRVDKRLCQTVSI